MKTAHNLTSSEAAQPAGLGATRLASAASAAERADMADEEPLLQPFPAMGSASAGLAGASLVGVDSADRGSEAASTPAVDLALGGRGAPSSAVSPAASPYACPEQQPAVGYSPLDVENALLRRLEPLRQRCGVKTLRRLQGELDDDDWKSLRRVFPAILVSYTGSPVFGLSGQRLEERLDVDVYVMDTVRRTTAKGQRPDSGHVGSATLLMAVREQLVGVSILSGLGVCIPRQLSGFPVDDASVFRLRLSFTQHIKLPILPMRPWERS